MIESFIIRILGEQLMVKRGSGVIKEILRDHFKGIWELNHHRFPKSFRNDIKETVEKAIKCGTRDMGFARYEMFRL